MERQQFLADTGIVMTISPRAAVGEDYEAEWLAFGKTVGRERRTARQRIAPLGVASSDAHLKLCTEIDSELEANRPVFMGCL